MNRGSPAGNPPEPSFLIIGAQKAGTTSLHEYLRTHPRLFLPAAKEFSFFNLDPQDQPYLRHDPARAKTLGRWGSFRAEVFGDAPAGAVCGWVNPAYMSGAPRRSALDDGRSARERVGYVPRAIHDRAPDIRLIASLRHPVERALSAHRMAVMRGRERRSAEDALWEGLDPGSLERARAAPGETDGYIVLGEYGRILEPYFELFEADQILISSLEALARDPAGVLGAVHRHIGVEGHVPPNLGRRYMAGADARRLEWLDIPRLVGAARDNRALRGVWAAVPATARGPVLARARRARYRLMVWNRRSTPAPAKPISDRLRRALDAHFEADAKLLEGLIGGRRPWVG